MFLEDKTINPGTPVKADPFSLESLIGWLEKQPAEGEYDWYDIKHCLICQYLTAQGIVFSSVGAWDYATSDASARIAIPNFFAEVSNRCHTFGDALQRARALAEKR